MSKPSCPERTTLSDFLLGKLDPQASSECENHLAQCEPCIETISGLDISDTFQSLVVDANAESEVNSAGDQSVVGNLIHRMIDVGKETRPERKTVDQRAADVVSLLEPATANDSIGQIEHYRIEEILGCGSTGVVFRAIDENLHRPVAIKVLRPTLGQAARERFIAEARATAALDHPNIVTIFQVGDSGSLAFIVMQWLPGETLEQRLERESVLSAESVRGFGQQIADGLAAAHDKGLVHRDIKPANLWITKNEQVKILDFGLVRIMDESPQLTCTGMIAGTPCYMSPEQSRGDELDSRSDLFSLGCVLYQCLTGKLPFASSNALATLQAIQREQPAPPSVLDAATPADVSDLVMSLLEKSPHRRPGSTMDVSDAFASEREEWPFECDNYCHSKPVQAKPVLDNPRPQSQASSLWRSIALALAAGLIGFGAFMFGPQIIRIATDQGEIVIQSNDPDVQVEVLSGGETIEVVDLKTKQSIQIKSGNYQIRAVGDQNSISIDKETLTLSRGDSEIVTVTRKISDVQLAADAVSPPAQAFSNAASRLPVEDTQIDPNHKVNAGDVLLIFVTHVLGSFEDLNSFGPSYLGIPFPVRGDGSISVPLLEPFDVKGKTVIEIEHLLREKYIGEIIKDDGTTHVSVVVQSVYGGKSKTLSEPVYDGMNFAECLNTIKYERDGRKLWKPILGIIELKSAAKNPELVDQVLAAVLLVERENLAGVATSFMNWITKEQLQRLALELCSSDTYIEWSILNRHFLSHWKRIRPIEDEFITNVLNAIERDKVESDLPTTVLQNILRNRKVTDKTRQRSIKPMLQSAIHSEDNTVIRFVALVNLDRSMPGLGEAVAEAISSHEEMRLKQWEDIVSGLSDENKHAAIVAFTKKVLSSPWSQRSARIIAFLPDETFKLVEAELENALIAKNGNAEAIKKYREEHKRKREKERESMTEVDAEALKKDQD